MNMIGSCLLQYGYSSKTENNCCSVYTNKTLYVNGLLNLDRSDTHIHNIDAKRYKVDNDSATYLWHCRLGHISVKRMKKLHVDGILESLDYESFDTCEPCLMSKKMKTERKRTELGATIFVFTFFAEAETNTETPEMNTETDTTGNGHGANTKRIWKQKWALIGT